MDNQNINQDATAEEILDFLQDKTNSTSKDVISKEDNKVKTNEENIDVNELKEFASEITINNETSNSPTANDAPSSNNSMKASDLIDSRDPTMHFDKMFANANLNEFDPFVLDLSKVTITDSEKEEYLRSVLLSERFITSIDVKGFYKITFQSKLLEEQKFIANHIESYAIEVDSKDRHQLLHSPVDVYVYALKLNVIFANPLINEKPVFSNDLTLEQKLELIESFPVAKWNLLVNAARIFEKKENLLSKFILDEDF